MTPSESRDMARERKTLGRQRHYTLWIARLLGVVAFFVALLVSRCF